jgi:hypothetical protein
LTNLLAKDPQHRAIVRGFVFFRARREDKEVQVCLVDETPDPDPADKKEE